MLSLVRSAIAETFLPMLRRPPVLQMAALCHRMTDDGPEVLLVSSSRGRWILPKGWPIDGKTAGETALQEAWEEAGVHKAKVIEEPVGSFISRKRFDNGTEIPCETKVYAVKVRATKDAFPESHKRDVQWVAPEKAVKLVDDDGLRDVLTTFLQSKARLALI